MTTEQKQRLRIGIGIVIGFIVGIFAASIFIKDSYNLLGNVCISAFVVPICAIVGGLIGGLLKSKS